MRHAAFVIFFGYRHRSLTQQFAIWCIEVRFKGECCGGHLACIPAAHDVHYADAGEVYAVGGEVAIRFGKCQVVAVECEAFQKGWFAPACKRVVVAVQRSGIGAGKRFAVVAPFVCIACSKYKRAVGLSPVAGV